MTLDSSVMNVSIRQVAADVGTTVTGVQTAITLYTLVMASLMITASKIGSMIGRRRALALGLVIYGAGSGLTAIATSLPVLLVGWSFLEGVGAALILPAIVALIAGNFPQARRSAAYGSVAAAGAIAVAVGPLIGGAVTTLFSWRWVFVGEVVVVVLILAATRVIVDAPSEESRSFDFGGAVLSIVGLVLVVLGVLKSGEWGWFVPETNKPSLLGTSPVLWMLLGVLLIIWLFFVRATRRQEAGKVVLLDPGLLRLRQVSGGLVMFFFQFLTQSGLFFVVPLFLSVVLQLSALDTGLRILPLSGALLVSALLVPRLFAQASPRLIVRCGILLMMAGTAILISGIDLEATAGVVALPMVLIGLGVGSMSSQLGAVTVSGAPDSKATEIGGLQNTATNLGASLGTALAGAILISALSSGLSAGISGSSELSADVKAKATTQLSSSVPFVSDVQVEEALSTTLLTVSEKQAVLEANRSARIRALDASLSVILLLEGMALFFTSRLPRRSLASENPEVAPKLVR
jgi:MFS family permease